MSASNPPEFTVARSVRPAPQSTKTAPFTDLLRRPRKRGIALACGVARKQHLSLPHGDFRLAILTLMGCRRKSIPMPIGLTASASGSLQTALSKLTDHTMSEPARLSVSGSQDRVLSFHRTSDPTSLNLSSTSALAFHEKAGRCQPVFV
jgi:hypothetical protein